jgi:hypothetical protein
MYTHKTQIIGSNETKRTVKTKDAGEEGYWSLDASFISFLKKKKWLVNAPFRISDTNFQMGIATMPSLANHPSSSGTHTQVQLSACIFHMDRYDARYCRVPGAL